VLPEELGRWHEIARAERTKWKDARVPFAGRRPLLLRALCALYEEKDAP